MERARQYMTEILTTPPDATRKDLEKARDTIKDLAGKQADLEAKIAAAAAAAATTQADLQAKLDIAKKELKTAQASNAANAALIAKLEAKIKALEAQLAAAKAAVPNTKPLEAQVAQLQKQLAAAKALLLAKQQQFAGKVQQLQKKLRAQGINPAIMTPAQMTAPAVRGKIIRAVSIANSTVGDKAVEYWYNSILSLPVTHAANITGNMGFGAWEVFGQRLLETVIGQIPGLREGSPAAGELGAVIKGVLPGLAKAARNGMLAFSTELPVLQAEVLGLPVLTGAAAAAARQNQGSAAIDGRTGRVIRVPTRGLLAEDEFFKTWFGYMNAAGYAYSSGKEQGLTGQALSQHIAAELANMQSAAWSEAVEESTRLAFQSDLGAFGKAVLKTRDAARVGGVPVGQFVLPFVTTPLNIFKRAAEKTPLVTAVTGVKWAALAASHIRRTWNPTAGLYQYDMKQRRRDLANTALSWAIVLAIRSLLGDDDDEAVITGTRGSERGINELEARSRPPLSIRIGETWYSYSRIEPFATVLGIVVDGVQAAKNAPDGEAFSRSLTEIAPSLLRIINDKTMLKGISDVINVLENRSQRGTEAKKWASSFAASWVPNLVRGAQDATRPNVMDRNVRVGDAGSAAAMGKNIAERTASALSSPLDKIDAWGRPVTARQLDQPAADFVYRMIVPMKMAKVSNELEIDRLLLNWNNQVERDPTGDLKMWAPTPPTNIVTVRGKQIRLTDAEYSRLLKEGGTASLELCQNLLESGTLDPDKPTPRMIDAIEKVRQRSYDRVRRAIIAVR